VLTSIFSSFCTWVFHVCAARALGWTDEEIKQRLEMAFLGDDSVVTVDPKHTEYNMKHLERFAPVFGMTYTSATKGKITQELVDLRDLEYLKRRFERHGPRLVLAPLRLSSILESLMFEQEGASWEDRKNTWNSALHEATHHGHELYDRLLIAGLDYFQAYGETWVVPPFIVAWKRLTRERPLVRLFDNYYARPSMDE